MGASLPHISQLWRLLLSRAQDVLRRDNADSKDKAAITRILDSGLIPLPILDKVMGFDAEEALRVRRELQQQKAVRFWCSKFLLIRGSQVWWGTGLSTRLFSYDSERVPFLLRPVVGDITPILIVCGAYHLL